jgi:N-acetyl-gamma-glutamyl-phosphate reductase
MKTVGIIGASGFTGHLLSQLIDQHPSVELKVRNSSHYKGQKVKILYPSYKGDAAYSGYSLREIATLGLDLIFLALPHKQSMDIIAKLEPTGVKLIDLSADHRFQDPTMYKRIYGKTLLATKRQWIYGLPELFREDIKKANAVALPGCYATAAILAVYPLQKDIIHCIFDCVSGWSGAGRDSQYAKDRNLLKDNLIAYSLVKHRHKYEIEQFLGNNISFTPHVFSAIEGLMCTAHILMPNMSAEEIKTRYKKQYQDEPFTIITEKVPDIQSTVGTNICQIGGFETDEAGQLVVVATLDNLIKGAAGQAVQNMNLMFGFDETTGLQSSVTLKV